MSLLIIRQLDPSRVWGRNVQTTLSFEIAGNNSLCDYVTDIIHT